VIAERAKDLQDTNGTDLQDRREVMREFIAHLSVLLAQEYVERLWNQKNTEGNEDEKRSTST
jgi:hypothetical protein